MEPTQIAPMDNAYLAMDGDTTNANVCLLMPVEGTITLRELQEQVAGGVQDMPSLRRRLHVVAMGLDRPWWVDDAKFSIAHHVRETTVRAPGDEAAIAEAVVGIAGEHLDRNHPLWEVHLLQVPGTKGAPARSMVISKIHHAIADGWRYREILNALFGRSVKPGPVVDPMWRPKTPPPDATLLGRSAAETAQWYADQVMATAKQATEYAKQWPNIPMPAYNAAPLTPFNKSVSAARSWARASVEIADSKPARQKLGVTVNDVFLAMIGSALGTYLEKRDALPEIPLVALVPMSQRHLTADKSGANRIAIGSCAVPTHLTDPVERLRAAHESMSAAKDRPMMNEQSLGMATRVFASTMSTAGRMSSGMKMGDSPVAVYNMLVSNVSSGDDSLHVAGKTLTHQYPIPPVFDGMALNITTHGYLGHLDLGVHAATDVMTDVDEVVQDMVAAYEEICALG